MSQATLRTSRIRLVPLADEHLEYEVELDSDPEVRGRPEELFGEAEGA
jgi:hypothetical protein